MKPWMQFALLAAATGGVAMLIWLTGGLEPKPLVTQGPRGPEWRGRITQPDLEVKTSTLALQGPDLHILASKVDSRGWQLSPGATLDQVMDAIEKEHERLTTCGQMGDWVLDQNGNVMYRRMNPPCPTVAKPKGYGNYCDADLAEIGQETLPERFRPRTLGCR